MIGQNSPGNLVNLTFNMCIPLKTEEHKDKMTFKVVFILFSGLPILLHHYLDFYQVLLIFLIFMAVTIWVTRK